MVASEIATGSGGPLAVDSWGSGPGVVVVHGSAVAARHFERLAEALAPSSIVHLYDRRGRGDRGPVDDTHGVRSDIEDLRAVLAHTGARSVFAHSYGGLVALRGLAGLPVARLAVYDAAVSIDGAFPSAYVEPFARAAADGDFARAMAVLGKGLQSVGPLSRLPLPVLAAMARVFAATQPGREWRAMVPSAVVEAREVLAHDAPASVYAGVTAEVLLLTGGRSPAYFLRASQALAAALPRVRHVVVPGLGHDAITAAAAPLVGLIAEFLAAP